MNRVTRAMIKIKLQTGVSGAVEDRARRVLAEELAERRFKGDGPTVGRGAAAIGIFRAFTEAWVPRLKLGVSSQTPADIRNDLVIPFHNLCVVWKSVEGDDRDAAAILDEIHSLLTKRANSDPETLLEEILERLARLDEQLDARHGKGPAAPVEKVVYRSGGRRCTDPACKLCATRSRS